MGKKAKKLLKKHKKKSAGVGAATGALAAVAGDIATKVLTHIVEDTITPHLKKGSKKKGARRDEATGPKDPAAAVVRALCERGPQTVPDLLDRTGGRLVDVLRALRELREFRLVEWDEDDERVRLTRTGDRTATVLGKSHVRDAAELVGK